MTPHLGTPVGHREIIRMIQARKAAEATGATAQDAAQKSHRTSLGAIRDEMTGQFYALSPEDRAAFDKHCQALLEDLAPRNYRERWLATAIAEDQWRLNRARALENNIFALGMSGEIADQTDAGSPEVHAAVCQARVWLRDGRNLQLLALYEQRIRRGIERNEKQLRELQSERQAARQKALDETMLLARVSLAEGRDYDPAEFAGTPFRKDGPAPHGFEFSAAEITRLVHREIRLEQARRLQNQQPGPSGKAGATPSRVPQAA